jgi:GNAT superfamily N-acetyltransferase
MSYYLDDAIVFHNTLNPKLWDRNGAMHSNILQGLRNMAAEFQDFLGLEELDVLDITISGSNAAYTYTPHSDIDLHLVVKVPEDAKTLYKELFDAKKNLYNLVHDQKIKGFDVEFYVQNDSDPVQSMGIFSVMRNRWISVPKKIKATIDDQSVKSKVADFKSRIQEALNSDDYLMAQKAWDDFKNMRRSGLERGGEFSPENLAFKILRTQGYQDSLYDHIKSLKDRELSVESLQETPTTPSISYQELDGSTFYYQYIGGDDTARKRLKYLSQGYDLQHETNLIALQGDKVIGAVGLQKSPYEENVLWMLFVSVDPEFQGKGVAKNLVQMIFEYAKKNDLRLRISSYSDMGEKYLKKVFDHYQEVYSDVQVKDSTDHHQFDQDIK